MSDYSTSSFAAPEVEQPTSLLAGTASQFSAPRFDRNLRALQEVESTWRLPGLPDVVKYDLASLDTDEAGIKDLLLGLDTELNEQPAARPSRLEVPKPSITGLQQLQVILAANTNNPAPTGLSDDAVKEWQREAMRRGVLDEDTDVDGVWRPEYNRMKREMAWDRQNEALRGNRPGAMPVTGENGIMKLINDFTSPAGLLSAATELDLFWDFDAIGEEFRSWGDKWREVGRSKNPLDFAGNLIDALTGPIDDLLVPVVNNVMLVSGVGTAFNVGRAFMAGRGAYAATRVAQSAQAFERIYNMGRVGSWIEKAGFGARAAANIDEIGRAGMLANRFQKMGGAPAVVGRGMEAWRQFTPVRASKELVQQGMRLGTMATLQNDYMGSYASDGASLNQLPGVERLQSGLEVVKASPRWMIPEVALAPYNIFSPGTFINRTADSVGLGSLLGQKVFQGLGTIGGRAAAGALVGTVAGTIAGDDAGDIALGAAIGAAGGAAAPAAGRVLASTPGAGAARGAAVGALAGAWLGDDPQDALMGAAAGAGLFAVTDTARQAFAHTVGASKWNKFVKGAGRALEMTSFKPLVDNNERIGLSFNTGMRRWLQDDPDGLRRWDDAFGRSGLYGALEETLGLDAESAAGFVGFTYLSSAIDWIATAQAGGKGDDFYERYLMFRTKLTSQLRHIPNVEAPTTAMLDDLAGAMARAELGHANYQKVASRARQLRKQMEANPAEALKLANEHDMRATETVRQLFNPKNFPAAADDLFADVPLADQVGRAIGPEWASMANSPDQLGTIMVGYMPQMMESFGRWDNFTVATAQIRDLRASGLFDDIALKGFRDRTGKVRPPRSAKRTVNQQAQKLAQDMDDLTLEGKLGERVAKMTPFAPAYEHGRITVMRIDGVTQQDLEEVAERLADVKKAHEYWQSAGAGAAKLYKEVGDEFAGRLKAKSVEQLLAGTSLGPADSLKDFTDAQIKVVAQELAGKLKGKKGFDYLLNFARRHDLSFADMDDALVRMTDEIVNDAAMWRKFGLADTITDADGLAGRVHGVDALSLRLKEVQRKASTTAAEVDLDELARRYEADASAAVDSFDFSWAHDIGGAPVRNAEGRLENAETVRLRRAREEFAALPDDAYVTVYHATSKANAERLLSTRSVDPAMAGSNTGAESVIPGDLYVTGAFDKRGRFGDTTLAITVRKGDIKISPEAMTTVDFAGISEAEAIGHGLFTLRGQGAVLKSLDDADMRITTKGGSVKISRPNPKAVAKAQEVRQLQEWLTENGYKAVHGREFLMPEDVAFGDMMFDVTRRHLNAATIGNWFKGKTPIEQKLVNDRRRRLALVDELSKAGKDYHPEDRDVTNILGDLQEFMRQEHDRVTELMRLSHEETFGKRMVDRLRSSFSPVDIADAGANKKKLISFLKNERGLSDELAEAAWRATHKFRSTDFQDVGLYALEAKARSMNVAEWGLKTLTGSKYEGIIQRARGPMAGAAVGATIGAVQTLDDPDMSFEDKVRAAARGAAIGAGAAVAGQVLGTAASEGIGTALTKFNMGAGGSLVDRSANWRYGYIGDWAARARDSLRFTLSPFFDISRYTEGFMLAQTAAPTRLADGSRNVMPLNMSPSGLRRRIAKMEGLTKEQARVRYDGYMSEFARAARGDFDPEAMAEAGKWFKQVGIMGFSPTDWMGTAFAQMRLNGIDPETAYRSAREMYTYATKGRTARSAAEMSANFIVFPFSFQKKALTHIGKWMNDDLARSIMIHDALKTYEILDKEYDLDQFWKDHVPMLRQLQRLNMFAYGLSAGRFGGMNSQLFEGAGKVAWNLFVPANLEIKDAAAAKEAQDVFRQLMPAINDINWMIDNVKETGNVMFSDQHVTSSAQVRRAYDEWYEFKEQFEEEIARQGYTFGEVMNSEWTQDIAQIYRQKQAELEAKYPAWRDAKERAIMENVALSEERGVRSRRYELALAQGVTPKPDDRMFFEMERLIDQAKEDAAFFSDGGTELPVAYINQIRDLGMSFARKNPGFIGLWRKYFEHEFGPLDIVLSM